MEFYLDYSKATNCPSENPVGVSELSYDAAALLIARMLSWLVGARVLDLTHTDGCSQI